MYQSESWPATELPPSLPGSLDGAERPRQLKGTVQSRTDPRSWATRPPKWCSSPPTASSTPGWCCGPALYTSSRRKNGPPPLRPLWRRRPQVASTREREGCLRAPPGGAAHDHVIPWRRMSCVPPSAAMPLQSDLPPARSLPPWSPTSRGWRRSTPSGPAAPAGWTASPTTSGCSPPATTSASAPTCWPAATGRRRRPRAG